MGSNPQSKGGAGMNPLDTLRAAEAGHNRRAERLKIAEAERRLSDGGK